MGLISQSTSSYKGGVSQQPDIIRFPDQVEQQINALSSEIQGLQKRPPTLHIKRLGNKIDGLSTKFHIIDRDDQEQYILGMSNGALSIWDLKGNPKTVTIQQDASYLNVVNPQKDFRAITVADYTFLLNRNVKTEMDTAISDKTGQDTALAYVKNAQYAKSYALFLGGTFMCGMITPDGGEAKQAVQTTSAFIAQRLVDLCTGDIHVTGQPTWQNYDQLLQNLGGRASAGYSKNKSFNFNDYNFSIKGDSVIAIQKKDGSTMPNIIVKDGFGNTNAYAIKGYVNSVPKLPPAAPDGYIMRIKGESNSSDDDYYVKYDENKNAWLETVAPGITFRYKYQTMPHAIVRQADGTFVFKRLQWVDRKVGDQDSNTQPSFIGNKINDIFFYRNRLGLISEQNVILSATSDFFNFWFKSAAAIADTDPIDLAVSSNKVSILTHAVPFARELMLFSREGQFVLSSDGVMTPKSAKVDQITAFNYSDDAQPLGVGQSIFFINNRVNYCSLMRYYTVQDVADLKDAQDTSAHVPTYIPKGIFKLSGNTTQNILTLCSRAQPHTVWIFKYIILNGQSLQQSWSKWTFRYKGSQVLMAQFVGAQIYFLINTDGGLFLQKASLISSATDFQDEPIRLFMDRKLRYVVPQTNKYSDFNDYTQVSFMDIYGAVPKSGVATYCLIGDDGYYNVVQTWDTNGVFRIRGDYRGKTCFVGRQFPFSVQLSKQLIKQENNNGSTVSQETGRLQLRYYWLNYSNSGAFSVNVDNYQKNKHFKYEFTSKLLSTSELVIGKYMVSTGKFQFPIQDNNQEVSITINTQNPLPINLISGGWEGLYIRRNTKV